MSSTDLQCDRLESNNLGAEETECMNVRCIGSDENQIDVNIEELTSHEPTKSGASNENNVNTCKQNNELQIALDTEIIKRTFAQLKMSVREVARVMYKQTAPPSGESRILKEIADMKQQLCELNKNVRDSMYSKVNGSVFAGETTFQDGHTASDLANDAQVITDANLSSVSSLEYIRATIKSLLTQYTEKTSEVANKMLMSILKDVDKILNSLAISEMDNAITEDENKFLDLITSQSQLKSTSQLEKVMTSLKKQIKYVKADASFSDVDVESTILSILTTLKTIVQSDRLDSNRLEKIDENLKSLSVEIDQQDSGSSPIGVKLNEIRKLINKSANLSANRIFPSGRDQCLAGLSETPHMTQIMAQFNKLIPSIKPDAQLPDSELETNISIIMDMLKDILQAKCADSKKMEKVAKVMKCLQREVCKQRPCESDAVTKVHHIAQLLRNCEWSYASSNEQMGVHRCCTDQTNDNQGCESLDWTPELQCLAAQLQSLIRCLMPDVRFASGDVPSVMLCIFETLKLAIDYCSPSMETLEKFGDSLKCLENELCKQGQEASTLISKINEIQQMLHKGGSFETASHQRCSEQCNANQGYSVRSSTEKRTSPLKPTRLLTCLIKHLENFIRSMRPDLKFPGSDLESNIIVLLDNLKGIIQSEPIELKALEKIPKMLRCLECDLNNQGQDGSTIMDKVRELRRMLTNKPTPEPLSKPDSVSQSVTSQSRESLDWTPELQCLTAQLQSLIRCLMSDVQFASGDVQSVMLCIFETLKLVINSCSPSMEILEKIGHSLRCLENELRKQGQAALTLISKINEIQQMLPKGGSFETTSQQRCSGLCIENQGYLDKTGSIGHHAKLIETPDLRCLVTELQKIIHCLRKGIQFKICDIELAMLCVMKVLKEILQNQNLSPHILTRLDNILDSIGNEVCKQNFDKSNIGIAIYEVKQLICLQKECNVPALQASECASCGRAYTSGNLEEIVGRTVKTMNECIKELEFILRDFLTPHDTDVCDQDKLSCCLDNE